jgi:hypothetical protein
MLHAVQEGCHHLWNDIRSAFQRGESILKVYPFTRLSGLALAVVTSFSISISVVAVVSVLLLSTRKARAPAAATRAEPVRSLPLTLAAEGGRLTLGWDRGAPAIQAGECGVLWIADGAIRRRVILDATQLHSGKLFYWPVNKDVTFEIEVPEGKNRSGETVCGNSASSPPLQSAEGPTRRKQRAERTASRNRPNTVRMAQRQRIESRQSEDVSGYKNTRIKSSNPPAFTIAGESQLAATLPVPAVQLPAVSEKQILSTAIMPLPKGGPEPYSTVTVEAVKESRLSRIVGKIPLLRRLHRTPEFLPPRPVRETNPTVPAELRRTLKSEVRLDVCAYLDESGKVTYAQMLSNITEANRDLASIAVFDARHWEFMPAQLGGHIVPGQVILHYRFGNPLM